MACRMGFRLAIVFVLLAPMSCAARVQSKSVICEGQKFKYLIFAPPGEGPLPAILLLHGAGDTPDPMVEAWQALANKQNIVLIAPELPSKPEFESIAPKVFHCVMEQAKLVAHLDPKRLYVFGNSMGGYLAFDALAFQSDYFSGVAVHSMGIDPQYDSIFDHATRKLPVAIFIGDHDPLVALEYVRRTRDLLNSRGFPVRYVELKNHDHNYYAVSEKVNADVWQYFQSQLQP